MPIPLPPFPAPPAAKSQMFQNAPPPPPFLGTTPSLAPKEIGEIGFLTFHPLSTIKYSIIHLHDAKMTDPMNWQGPFFFKVMGFRYCTVHIQILLREPHPHICMCILEQAC